MIIPRHGSNLYWNIGTREGIRSCLNRQSHLVGEKVFMFCDLFYVALAGLLNFINQFPRALPWADILSPCRAMPLG